MSVLINSGVNRVFPATLFLVATLISGLTQSSVSAADFLAVSYRNDSNIPVTLGVRMVNGQYRWDDLKPGESGRVNVQFQYLVPLIDGAQSVQIALKTSDGRIRTGRLRVRFINNFGTLFGYSSGRVIRRSPGVPGIVDN